RRISPPIAASGPRSGSNSPPALRGGPGDCGPSSLRPAPRRSGRATSNASPALTVAHDDIPGRHWSLTPPMAPERLLSARRRNGEGAEALSGMRRCGRSWLVSAAILLAGGGAVVFAASAFACIPIAVLRLTPADVAPGGTANAP